MNRRFLLWAVLLLATAACAGLAGEPAIVATIAPRPTTPVQPVSLPAAAADLALGAQVYAENCTRCHGLEGRGDGESVQSGRITEIVDFTDPATTLEKTPAQYYEIITNGRLETLMPPWADSLNETQRWAVAMYTYLLPHTPDVLTVGQAVWQANCAECHGQAGEGAENGAPLPSLDQASNADILLALADGIPDKMPSFSDTLSAEQRQAVMAYARSLDVTNLDAAREVALAPAATDEAEVVSAPQTTSTTGVITGTVVNGTADAPIPTDLTLTLRVLDSQFREETFETGISADGTYRFENVPFRTDRQYVVTTLYGGSMFVSDLAQIDPAANQLELPLTIYEVSDDPANIRIDRIVSQVAPSGSQLEVVQVVSFINLSDRVYLQSSGDTRTSVRMNIPPGALFEDFTNGRYVQSSDGTQVIDTAPVVPGEPHLMHLVYTLPYSGRAALNQTLDYALTGSVEVLVESGVTISSPDLPALGTRTMGDRSYNSYGAEFDRPAGSSLAFEVSGSPAAETVSAPGVQAVHPIAYVLIGAGLSAILIAGALVWRERRAPRPDSRTEINALMEQIAALDAQHESGQLNRKAYEKRRAALKAQLVTLMKATKSGD